ncbi:MAG: DUF1631 domain-containing protein [Chromatiales bacterium]|nr:DUF1631 domain-containing protein [Chromatiales bacterium]
MVLLTTQLEEMFEQATPTLLDFSDKAETNDKQRLFYDAINQIKKLRDEVEYTFREEIGIGFEVFSKGNTIPSAGKSVNVNQEGELSIVDNQELEEHIASERIVSKTENHWYQELYGLSKRMGLIQGGVELSMEEIPGGPAHTMYAFEVAARRFEFDLTVLLIIYALFDKYVMQQSGDLYESYNAKLIEAGIFPNLKLTINKPNTYHSSEADLVQSVPLPNDGNRETQPTPPPSDAAKTPAPQTQQPSAFSPTAANYDLSSQQKGEISTERAANIAIGEEIFQSIRSIMADRRRADPSFRNHPEINPSIKGVVMTERPELVASLHTIQPPSGTAYIPGFEDTEVEPDNIEIDHGLLQEIRATLVTERDKLYNSVDKNTIPTADLDTIELVGMLFEHVLNDEELPNIVKALISHLHTPYLKIAIIDQSFLVDAEHTARQLLNQVVDAGKQWVDEQNLHSGLYYPMKEIVNEILNTFNDDLAVIDKVQEKLSHQIEELNQKAQIVEERAREAAKGRERLESARSRAHRLIDGKLGGHTIHPIVTRFLNAAWLDKMILMMLRNPNIEKTEEWRDVVTVIDTITWVCDAKNQAGDQTIFKQTVSNLKEVIENGLASLGDYHQPDSQALFQLLDSFARGIPASKIKIESNKENVTSRFGPPKEAEQKRTPLNAKERKIADILANIEFGTWFELLDDSQAKRELKLSWFSPVTKKYMFVDRSGIQAFVISTDDLVRQISNRTARVVTKSNKPFVDATLNTIKTMLLKTFGMEQPAVLK